MTPEVKVVLKDIKKELEQKSKDTCVFIHSLWVCCDMCCTFINSAERKMPSSHGNRVTVKHRSLQLEKGNPTVYARGQRGVRLSNAK